MGGPGRLAPWLLWAAALAAAALLKLEMDRGPQDPPPLPIDPPALAGPRAGRDVADAPGPDGPEAASDASEEAAPVFDLFVTVRTASGKPLPWRGVGLRARGETGRRTRFTERDGVARFALDAAQHAARDAGALEAFLRDPGRPDLAVAVEPRATNVVLVATDGVVARLLLQDLRDDLGRLVPDRTTVDVSVEGEAAPSLAYSVVGGWAFVAGLPSGAPVRFVARPYGLPAAETWAVFPPPPAAPGDDVAIRDVTLPLFPAASAVEGQWPTPLRRPGSLRLTAWYGAPAEEPTLTVYVATDDRGVFRAGLPPGGDVLLEVRPAAGGPPQRWFAPLLKKAFLDATAVDRGPLRSGAVYAANGAPAEGALVLSAPADDAGDRADEAAAPCAVADKAGRFELRTPADGRPRRIEARYLEENTTCTAREEGPASDPAAPVELRLSPGGTVAGRLVGVPSEILLGLGGLSAYVAVESEGRHAPSYVAAAPDGTFEVSAPAGRARVRAFVPGLPPITVEDVAVPRGERASDPRLQALSTGAEFETATIIVEVVDGPPEDRRAPSAVVSARFPDDPEGAPRREPLLFATEANALARIPFPKGEKPEFTITYVDRNGRLYRPAVVRGAGRHVAALRPGARVTFAPDAPLPDPPSDVIATFVAVQEEPKPPEGASPRTVWRTWRAADGPPGFLSVPDGAWRAKLEIVREGAVGAVVTLDLGRFEIRDVDVDVSVPIPAAAAAAALLGR